MNIGFVNQKGGVGKTTLAILFSDFLNENNDTPICLDFDVQGSLYQKWEVAKDLIEQEPDVYVIKCELSDSEQVLEEASKTEQTVLFDLPGSLDNPDIQKVLQAMDIIICPFLYEPISFESTLFFAEVVTELKMKAQVIFVPNMVKSNVKYSIKEQVNDELAPFGVLAPEIKDLVTMQRIDFFNITQNTRNNVQEAFFFISKQYQNS